MKRIALLALIIFATSGCSISCDRAREDVIEYVADMHIAMVHGNTSAWDRGKVEALKALEVAKRACNKPELTIEQFYGKGLVRCKARQPC